MRLGQGVPLDFSARGEVDRTEPDGFGDWQSRITSEVTAVRLEEPEDLLMTPALEEEPEVEEGEP